LNTVFNPPLEIVHRLGQQLLIDREHFLSDGILQLVQITGFVSVPTALLVLPEEEMTSQVTLGAMVHRRNAVPSGGLKFAFKRMVVT
jgi:hypothetical protein